MWTAGGIRRRRGLTSGGDRSAAWGLRYQYLRTLEALMDALEEPRPGVVAVHVEGLPRDGERALLLSYIDAEL